MIPDATTTARRALGTILWAAILAAPVACDPAGPEARGPISDDTYVIVMSELADLRRFPPGGRDQMSRDSAADAARRAVLDRYGVTADELLGFAETVGEHPARMVEISERISAVTDSLAELRRQGERAASVDTVDATEAAVAAPVDTTPGDTAAVDTVRDGDDSAAPSRIGERDEALRERIERFRERGQGATP